MISNLIRSILITFLFFLSASFAFSTPSVKYKLNFEDAKTHYIKIEMDIDNWSGQELKLRMPVWTPGSYLVREYARFVERFTVINDKNEKLNAVKFVKNGWRINTAKNKKIHFEYYVYAFDLSIRTCFADEEHAYVT